MRQPLNPFAPSNHARESRPDGRGSTSVAGSEGHTFEFLHWMDDEAEQLQPGFYLMRLRQNHARSRRQSGYRSSWTILASA